MEPELRDARARIEALREAKAPRATSGRWSVGQVLVHAAESIECSMRGFPTQKPRLLQWTVGALALRVFLARGSMRHDRNAPLPGGPEPEDLPVAAAAARLLRAIDELAAFEGPLARHVLFGAVGKRDYERYHALHLADHLAGIEPG